MMNPSAMKLARKFGLSVDVSDALVVAGYTNPRKIRDAKDSDLEKVNGVNGSVLAKLRKGKK